ncbi:MAG TPA: ester cyclase [Chloroflexia bacterium]|jgi:steroid delta-isomerase-like uncharacterized protein
MSAEENKAIVRRFYDAYDSNDLDAAAAVLADNFEHHNPLPGLPPGREGYKMGGAMFAAAFPDHHSTIEAQIAEGDTVVTRGMFSGTHQGDMPGLPASGKRMNVPYFAMDRLENGKIVERHEQFDQLLMLQQLGFMPAPGQ